MRLRIKALFTPGSISFFYLCLSVWLVLQILRPRGFKTGAVWLLLICGTYAGWALPVVANWLAGLLRGPSQPPPTALASVSSIVILDGDNRVGRVREALRLQSIAPASRLVVLGEAWIEHQLRAAGVPAGLVTRDLGPRTTLGQMEWVRQWVATRGSSPTALVASRLQMRRVEGVARVMGLSILPVASAIDDEPPVTGMRRFLPTYVALRVSRDAFYEIAALAYYRSRGWIRSDSRSRHS